MSYTAPAGNAVDFHFGDPGYSAPTGDGVNFQFDLLTVQIGQVNWIGQTPSAIAGVGVVDSAIAGQIALIGLEPSASFDLIKTAQQGVLALTGEQPSAAIGVGVIATPQQGILALTGLLPDFGNVIAHAQQAVITLSGLVPVAQFHFIRTAGQGEISLAGLTPDYRKENYTVAETIGLQFRHAFNGLPKISRDAVTYSLQLTSGLNQLDVPVYSFSLRRGYEAIGFYRLEQMIISCPASYYAAIEPYVGGIATLFRKANGIAQALCANRVDSVSVDVNQAAITTSANIYSSDRLISLSGLMYTRVSNSEFAVRLPPDFNVRPGVTVDFDGASMQVKTVVIYVSPGQSFMEMS